MKLSDEDKQLLKVSVLNRIELLGLWERIHNPDFKLVEFDQFRNEAIRRIEE